MIKIIAIVKYTCSMCVGKVGLKANKINQWEREGKLFWKQLISDKVIWW